MFLLMSEGEVEEGNQPEEGSELLGCVPCAKHEISGEKNRPSTYELNFRSFNFCILPGTMNLSDLTPRIAIQTRGFHYHSWETPGYVPWYLMYPRFRLTASETVTLETVSETVRGERSAFCAFLTI